MNWFQHAVKWLSDKDYRSKQAFWAGPGTGDKTPLSPQEERLKMAGLTAKDVEGMSQWERDQAITKGIIEQSKKQERERSEGWEQHAKDFQKKNPGMKGMADLEGDKDEHGSVQPEPSRSNQKKRRLGNWRMGSKKDVELEAPQSREELEKDRRSERGWGDR